MPDTPTSRLGLYKSAADGSENVDYSTDLGQNWDKLDQYVGYMDVPDQNARLAVAGFVGMQVRQVDTGAYYVLRATPASVAGNWIKLYPQIEPVPDQATRDALTNIYDGKMIYRTDRDWIEVYDGAAWRVKGIGTVSSVADRAAITNPYQGQVIFRSDFGVREWYESGHWRVLEVAALGALSALTGTSWVTDPRTGQLAVVTGEDGMVYRYNGSAWVRNERGLVKSVASTPSLLNVGSAVDVISTSFTPPVTGCYRLHGRVPFDVSASGTDARAHLYVGGSEVDYTILTGPGGQFVGTIPCDGPWDFTSTAAQTVKMTIVKTNGTATLNSRLVAARIDIYYEGPTGVKA